MFSHISFSYFDSLFTIPFQRVQIEGEVKVSVYKGGFQQKARVLIIFEDVLLIAKENKRAKSTKHSLAAISKLPTADVTALMTPMDQNDPYYDASLSYLVLNPRGDDPLLFRVTTETALLFRQALVQVFSLFTQTHTFTHSLPLALTFVSIAHVCRPKRPFTIRCLQRMSEAFECVWERE